MAGFDWQMERLDLYESVLDHFLNAPSGEVGQYLDRIGRSIVIAAKAQVGKDTLELMRSIHMFHSRFGSGQYVWIGSNNPIALAHHEGTRPHRITPRNHEFLRFSKGGRQIYSREVLHPGTRPNRYLSDNLILARL